MEYERFLEKIRQLRVEKRISCKKMGEALGISYAQYANIENGKSRLKVEDLFTVCKVLEVQPKFLFDDGSIKLKEYYAIIEGLKKLRNRDFRIIKDLIMLMSLNSDDL